MSTKGGHCCHCKYTGPMRIIGVGFICGGCHRYVVPCASCSERARQQQEVSKPAKRPLGVRLVDVLARIVGQRAPDEWMEEPLEVEHPVDPEPPGPTAADLEQEIQTAQVRAQLAKTKETVKR